MTNRTFLLYIDPHCNFDPHHPDQLMYYPPIGAVPEDLSDPDTPLKKILLWNGVTLQHRNIITIIINTLLIPKEERSIWAVMFEAQLPYGAREPIRSSMHTNSKIKVKLKWRCCQSLKRSVNNARAERPSSYPHCQKILIIYALIKS